MDAIPSSESTTTKVSVLPSDQQDQSRRIRWHPSAVIGLVTFGLVVLAVAIAPLLTPYNPNDQDLINRLQFPSSTHLLGTDYLGRDVFSRIVFGGRFSLVITSVAVLIGAVFGTLIGVIAGRRGGIVDEVVMRIIDLGFVFPGIILSLLIIAMIGPGFWTLVFALTITGWTPYARLARVIAMEINTQAYIEAATALGASEFLIMHKHILPNTLGPILAMGFVRFGAMLLAIAGLSYLGLGAQPPQADWGAMLADGQPFMTRTPYLVLTPGLTIFVTALSVTLAGQGLMLMFDPKQRYTN